MSRSGKRMAAYAEKVRAKGPGEEHVSPAARAVPGAFPAKHTKAYNVGCVCRTVIYQGEYIVRHGANVVHALCDARVKWAEEHLPLAALRAEEPVLARALARCHAGRQEPVLTVAEAEVVDRLAPGARQALTARAMGR